MKNLIKSTILSLLFVSCGTYVKYSDTLYSPVVRSGIYKPSGGAGSLMSDFQIDRAQLRWFNYYHLNMSAHYYNSYFGNNWYLHNQWRFNNSWRLTPLRRIYRPIQRPYVRHRHKVTPPTRRSTRDATTTVPSRRRVNNPRPRTNVNPQRTNTRNATPRRINNNQRIKHQ